MAEDLVRVPSFVCPQCTGGGAVPRLYAATAQVIQGTIATTRVSEQCGMCAGSGRIALDSPPC